MEPTTGLILRRITQTDLSVSAHKLATVILDAIAWKEGYNGLPRGTAAFTLADLASKMGVSRQYLTELLAELEASELELRREKPNGKFAPWIFRFTAFDAESEDQDVASGTGDTSLSIEKDNKTVFSGQITISAWVECLPDLLGGADQGYEEGPTLLECRHAGDLGPLLGLQPVARERKSSGGFLARLHAPMANLNRYVEPTGGSAHAGAIA